jgi:hypothetical protein
MAKSSTSFKPGNKVAVGNHFGRPPATFTDDELEVLGKQLIKFYNENPNAWCIQNFVTSLITTSDIWYTVEDLYEAADQRPAFSKYYQTVKSLCAERISQNAGTPKGLNAGIAHRFLPLYFRDLFKSEVEMKRAGTEETKPTEVHVHMHPDAIVKCE